MIAPRRFTSQLFAWLRVAILRLTTLRNSSIGFALPLFAWLRVATLLGVPHLRLRALVFAPLRLTPEALRSIAEGGVPNTVLGTTPTSFGQLDIGVMLTGLMDNTQIFGQWIMITTSQTLN